MQHVNLNYMVTKYLNMVFANKKTGVADMLDLEEFTHFVN
jgi:hypothetical protein